MLIWHQRSTVCCNEDIGNFYCINYLPGQLDLLIQRTKKRRIETFRIDFIAFAFCAQCNKHVLFEIYTAPSVNVAGTNT